MVHQLGMASDGILRLMFIGDTDKLGAEALIADFGPYLAHATVENPLCILWDDTRGGKASSEVRKFYADLNSDPRIGKVAIFGAKHYGRVLGEFILKFTGRDNIRFFDTQEQALSWLKE
ncbi:MAG TPA: STAS/SEC14 domain-containing protein [Anaerolineae bacterium]|nr:STAS/SEC14 domain-containing protein [Anaerolineae bacterium]HQI83951.1 STAS/SEC14 domain-containing protein [Anaerolineae bacterium]